ncbi:MAG: PQQ-binding-like beta-propeller repeat protein [Planctomycetales bacterium]|nr:PQQ-binding-like beta-propeller repeat protein [Planctomycetales bacterium]
MESPSAALRPARSARLLSSQALLSCLLLFGANSLHAENWPQWRGPDGNGISSAPAAPLKWSATENVRWRTPLPGPGGATPVIWGERIFVTSVDGDELVLLCIDTAGKQLWRNVVSTGNKDVRGDEGNSASPSPCTDGRHVWAFMGNGALACYDIDGKQVWKLDVQDRYGKLNIAFGMTSTPVLDKGRLFLQLIHGEGNPQTREAKVVALDAATGAELWSADRPSDASRECEHSYASPILYRDDSGEQLITHGADYVVSYDAGNGKELWRCGELNPKGNYNPTLRFVASPVATDGAIIVPSAKNGPVLSLSPRGKGDITSAAPYRLWTRERNTPDVPSPLVHDGVVYLCRENGTLICVDLASGEELYQERVHGQRHRASPVYAAGHLYMSARDGRVSVVKTGRKFELVAQNDLNEALSASPAIADGVLYLRTFDALYAIGK